MKRRPVKADTEHDNSAAAVRLRAEYAQRSLYHEAQIVADDVGGLMAVCALLGVAQRIAREHLTKPAYQALLIDVLYNLTKSEGK